MVLKRKQSATITLLLGIVLVFSSAVYGATAAGPTPTNVPPTIYDIWLPSGEGYGCNGPNTICAQVISSATHTVSEMCCLPVSKLYSNESIACLERPEPLTPRDVVPE